MKHVETGGYFIPCGKPGLIGRIMKYFKNSPRLDPERSKAWSLHEEEEANRQISIYKRLISPILSTDDQRRALEGLHASTTVRTSGLALKLGFLNDFYTLTERGIVNKKVISCYPSLYVCSGLDLELPLLMGSRDVEMLDSCFKEGLLGKFVDKIWKCRNFSQLSNTDFTFSFDYGNGEEKVSVKVIPKEVQGVELEKKYGLVLGFLSVDLDKILEPQKHLVSGGYYINSTFDSILNNQTNIGTDRCKVYVNSH